MFIEKYLKKYLKIFCGLLYVQVVSVKMETQTQPLNPYREALKYQRQQATSAAPPQVCLKCAGWKSFGGTDTPKYIANFGPICCCQDTWDRIQKILKKLKT